VRAIAKGYNCRGQRLAPKEDHAGHEWRDFGINTMVNQLNYFSSVFGGTWKDLTYNVNTIAANLESQVRPLLW
jgi:hypothetical protein